MRRRLIGGGLAAAWLGACILLLGCDSGTTGPTPETHDQDKKAGHMVYPAGGPNSPEAKAAAKKAEAK